MILFHMGMNSYGERVPMCELFLGLGRPGVLEQRHTGISGSFAWGFLLGGSLLGVWS